MHLILHDQELAVYLNIVSFFFKVFFSLKKQETSLFLFYLIFIFVCCVSIVDEQKRDSWASKYKTYCTTLLAVTCTHHHTHTHAMPCLVAKFKYKKICIVYCIHIGSATTSFKGFGNSCIGELCQPKRYGLLWT